MSNPIFKPTGLLPQPAICLPLVAADLPASLTQIEPLANLAPDLIEIRLDFWQTLTPETVRAGLQELAAQAKGIPLLATLRRFEEGGARPLSEDVRLAILYAALESGAIHLLDVELSLAAEARDRLLNQARQIGVGTIISYHDFEKTPPPAELAALLHRLAACPADILKLAVYPREPQDPLNLLAATYQAVTTWLDRPLATMAMGALGSFTRLAGPFYGSAITFAVGLESSAPGQLKIDIVRQLWQNWEVHKA